ncbi:M13 family metallopeptidase [Lysobacter panacisoli]|uniref:Peptidase n=1 Tax=Lysobacter panacisoli TaxID=1255263 RepID=A0ABP9LPH3_9GAMM|nr:M13-type metalloendopeptidase [Lysobacter panacisoli]
MSKPHVLLLSLAVSAGIAALAAHAAPGGSPTPSLDSSKLPAPNRFLAADIDRSLDACQDFGAYINQKWRTANPIPGDRVTWGSFEMLDERSNAIQHQLAEQAAANPNATGVERIVGDFFATGMDVELANRLGLSPLKPQLDAIAAIKDRDGLTDYLRRSAADGNNVLFGFSSGPDFKDSMSNIAFAMQGGLGLPDRTYYTDAGKAKELAAYQAHAAKVLELGGVPAADAAKQAADIVAFETRLAKVSKSRVELSRDAELRYNPVTLSQANMLTPNFDWTKFFASQGVAAPSKFSLAIPAFHQEVSAMLAQVPLAQWKSYLTFRNIDRASPYLSDAFVQENYAFYGKTLRGQQEIKPRWKLTLDTLNGQAGEALGQMYVKAAFPAESKARMETLVGNLRVALKHRLENLAWMSPETKQKALEKWAAFTPKIGYPDKWRDWTGLETTRASYIGNVQAANAFNYRWNIGKIGKRVDRTEWGMSPQTVNAYYRSSANEIVFPAAILQPPFFDPKADDALNYGGIGAVIGHEMIHGYDDQGSRFGPTGNFENWWTEADAAGFKKLTDQLVAQFNEYEAAPGKHVNGKLTLGENIADLGGLAVAYDALQTASAGKRDPKTDGLTRDQRFYANWATVWRRNFTPQELDVRLTTDSHAPANFRAIGAPSNLASFAGSYSCKTGQPMVRDGDKQIVIW